MYYLTTLSPLLEGRVIGLVAKKCCIGGLNTTVVSQISFFRTHQFRVFILLTELSNIYNNTVAEGDYLLFQRQGEIVAFHFSVFCTFNWHFNGTNYSQKVLSLLLQISVSIWKDAAPSTPSVSYSSGQDTSQQTLGSRAVLQTPLLNNCNFFKIKYFGQCKFLKSIGVSTGRMFWEQGYLLQLLNRHCVVRLFHKHIFIVLQNNPSGKR